MTQKTVTAPIAEKASEMVVTCIEGCHEKSVARSDREMNDGFQTTVEFSALQNPSHTSSHDSGENVHTTERPEDLNLKTPFVQAFLPCLQDRASVVCITAALLSLLVGFTVGLVVGQTSAATAPIPWAPLPGHETALTRIAFGSCADQSLPQPFWDVLWSLQPNLTVLGGDNVYGDCSTSQCEKLKATNMNPHHPTRVGDQPMP